jgi:hypothetical protein
MPSAKIMRKLRQLWNRQRFLTDDECDGGKDPMSRRYLEDSSMDYEVEPPAEASDDPETPKK